MLQAVRFRERVATISFSLATIANTFARPQAL